MTTLTTKGPTTMTTHPANDAAPALPLGAKATIQMGSLFIGCRVTEVSRTAHKATY